MSGVRNLRGANVDLFLAENSEYFEDPLTRLGGNEQDDYLVALPIGWVSGHSREWCSVAPLRWNPPLQGWKIHVSAIPANAERTLEIVSQHCLMAGIAFKYLRSKRTLLITSSKYAARSSSGKFITIYPPDTESLVEVLQELDTQLDGMDSPAILSDIRWGTSPLHTRFGGFVERWCEDEEGRRVLAIENPAGVLIPDRRIPYVDLPHWVVIPHQIQENQRASQPLQSCGYTFTEALHFSNGGGVYRGVRTCDGREVVLKEARPLAGLDGHGVEARERLRFERLAHRALDDIVGIPEVLDTFELDTHEFMVLEAVQGISLQQWVASEHPGVRGWQSEPESIQYADRALRVLENLGSVLTAVHERNWCHGDLHPGNVLVEEDLSVHLIDFEMAASPEHPRVAGLGCPGFIPPSRSRASRLTTDDDRFALGAIALWLFLPQSRGLSFDGAAATSQVAWAERVFKLPEAWRRLVGQAFDLSAEGKAPTFSVPSLLRGIAQSASPERSDRLFPGDVLQFIENSVQFAAGAAGVLWAQYQCGRVVPRNWIDWVEARADDVQSVGLFDGAAGIALALSAVRRVETSRTLLDRAERQLSRSGNVTVAVGRAGFGLALLESGEGDAVARAVALAEGILEGKISAAATPSGSSAGISDGWSGVAIFLCALAEATRDRKYLDEAVECIQRDLRACETGPDGGLYVAENGILYPYLAHGSAGIALALARVVECGGVATQEVVDGLLCALSPALVMEAGVFDGRAGLILALERMASAGIPGAKRSVETHRTALRWHGVGATGGTAVLGRNLARISMDYGTGSAGVAAVMSAVNGSSLAFPLGRKNRCDSSNSPTFAGRDERVV